MMRSIPVAALAGACLICLAVPAGAQAVDSGLEVQVNPIPSGGGLLLYPGGQYLRLVPPLRHPAEAPVPRGVSMRAAPRAAAPAPSVAQTPPPAPRVASAAPAPRPQTAPARPAPPSAPPPSSPAANSDFLSSLPTIGGPAPAPAPQASAPQASAPAPTKQGVILFAKDSAEPAESALESIRYLASQLNNAMTRQQSRVELMAYGGAKGDKGSDARRLSLKRALAIRQVLIDAGVSSTRINVHAEGGVDDTGPSDRVDVLVRT